MKEKISIIKLKPSESIRFKNIRLRSLKENPESFCTTYETAISWSEENWASQVKTLNTFIASYQGKDIGVVRSKKDEDNQETSWIFSMWVAPETRGLGVGIKLISAVSEWIKSGNSKKIKLEVVETNASAVKFYEKCGFKANGKTSFLPELSHKVFEYEKVLL